MMAARNQYEGWMSKRFSRSNLNQSPNVMPPRILGPNHSKKRLRHDIIKYSWMISAARLPDSQVKSGGRIKKTEG